MRIKQTVEKLTWDAQDAFAELGDRYLWRGSRFVRRGSDSALGLIGRAGGGIVDPVVIPARRRFVTRLIWPLTDSLRHRSDAARTAVATAGVIAAGLAAVAGAQMGGGDATTGASSVPAATLASAVERPHAPELASAGSPDQAKAARLRGVKPDFVSNPVERTSIEDRQGDAPKTATEAQAAETAKRFADAFVAYEVGESSDATASTFSEIAAPALARALAERPPRLPAGEPVPKARVLNVLVGERDGKRIEISVAIQRLEAVSEIRLNLREAKGGWLVSEVLG